MPHADFDAARRAYDEDGAIYEPVTFTLCGETFTARREPSWGDVLALANAPEINTEDDPRAVLALSTLIRAMLEVNDRERWDQVMFRIPASHAPQMLFETASYITMNMTGFPTMPLDSSLSTPRSTGASSSESTGGKDDSPTHRRTSAPRSSTGTSRARRTSPRNGNSIDTSGL